MQFKKTAKLIEVHFESLAEFFDTASTAGYISGALPISGDKHEMTNSGEQNNFRSEWTASESLEAFHGLFQTGWTEGAEKARSMLADVQSVVASQTEQFIPHWDVFGDEVDVNRYLSGEPENLIEYQPSLHSGSKIIRIAVEIGASSNVSAERLIWRGVLAAALVDRLESGGYRCEVVAQSLSEKKIKRTRRELLITWPIKSADAVLDLERLTLAVAHPSILRRNVLSIMEKLPQKEFNQFCGETYGYPVKENRSGADIYVQRVPFDAQEAADLFRIMLDGLEDNLES